ncbi:hypothetical protein ETAE_1835 [Edwardsiella piscicida]|uniref:Secreted protein n=1 Tax=Edwardsiella piscicida TaxID=1263550 RepID=A0AAU8PF13_EDWPI|nr:hypothetical protein ETAE_1835 [Edwardsiella tarda EIB202]
MFFNHAAKKGALWIIISGCLLNEIKYKILYISLHYDILKISLKQKNRVSQRNFRDRHHIYRRHSLHKNIPFSSRPHRAAYIVRHNK